MDMSKREKTEWAQMVSDGIKRSLADQYRKREICIELADMNAILMGRVLPSSSAYPNIKSQADAEARIHDLTVEMKAIVTREREISDMSLLSEERVKLFDICGECNRLLFCLKMAAHALNDMRAKREVKTLAEKVVNAKNAKKSSEGLPIAYNAIRETLALLGEYTKMPEEELLRELSLPTRIKNEIIPGVEKAAEQGGVRGGKSGARIGAREGVTKYNEEVLLGGRTGKRKRGGGRKAVYDVNELQCKALLALGQEVKDGKKRPPARFTVYADKVLRQSFPKDDCPFSYPAGGSGRECGMVRSMLLKRFDTYLKHLDHPMSRGEALPLANASE